MAKNGLPALRILSDELACAPRNGRLRLLLQIDQALSVIESGKEYSFNSVRDMLLGQRSFSPETGSDQSWSGTSLIETLVSLADQLSADSELSPGNWTEPLSSPADLARRFNVSQKTIYRWRRRGLVGWRFGGPRRPAALLFPEHCVRQFVSRNCALVRAAAEFCRLSSAERQTIITRARELCASGYQTKNAICGSIAAETGRAPETIRQVLKRHVHDQPHACVLCQMMMGSGPTAQPSVPVPAQAGAALTVIRAQELKRRKIKFISSPEFEAADAERQILDPGPLDAPRLMDAPADARTRNGLPSSAADRPVTRLLTPEAERFLFRKMNYLKHRACALIADLDPAAATAAQLESIERLLADAGRVKSEIVQANLRLVIHIAAKRRRPGQDLNELISDGNLALVRAVDSFDYRRGFKFSTYATWAIVNCFARSASKRRLRLQTNRCEVDAVPDCRAADEPDDEWASQVAGTVAGMLARLNERERAILSLRYGLGEQDEPHSLSEIASRFSLSKERIRQLQIRALLRLRTEYESNAPRLLRA